MQRAGVAEVREAVRPLRVTGDDEPDADYGGLLEQPGGVGAGELLADAEAPVILHLAGGLEVVEDLGGAELVAQHADPQDAGLDGTATLAAGQPLGAIAVGVWGAPHAAL